MTKKAGVLLGSRGAPSAKNYPLHTSPLLSDSPATLVPIGQGPGVVFAAPTLSTRVSRIPHGLNEQN